VTVRKVAREGLALAEKIGAKGPRMITRAHGMLCLLYIGMEEFEKADVELQAAIKNDPESIQVAQLTHRVAREWMDQKEWNARRAAAGRRRYDLQQRQRQRRAGRGRSRESGDLPAVAEEIHGKRKANATEVFEKFRAIRPSAIRRRRQRCWTSCKKSARMAG